MLNCLRIVICFFGFAALALASGCLSSTAPPAAPPSAVSPTAKALPRMVSGTGYEGMIFGDGAWTPDAEMVAALETRLPAYLAQNQDKFNATKPPIGERIAEYKRQYWGEMKDNKRVIVVNAMCRELENWRTQRVLILDGGDCFFNVNYDVDAGTFFDLSVNGEA